MEKWMETATSSSWFNICKKFRVFFIFSFFSFQFIRRCTELWSLFSKLRLVHCLVIDSAGERKIQLHYYLSWSLIPTEIFYASFEINMQKFFFDVFLYAVAVSPSVYFTLNRKWTEKSVTWLKFKKCLNKL